MLVERDAQLAKFLSLADQAAAGQGRVALLSGEAGIGKTSLLREVAQQLGDGHRILWGGCEALFTPRPLGPLQDMANALDPGVTELLEGDAAPGRLFSLILNSFETSPRPIVAIFEDMHWADRATLDLVKYIGRRVAMLPALIVLSYRTEEAGVEHPLQQVIGDLPQAAVSRIVLEPLSPDAVAELARRLDRPSADLHRITQGNPFFVSELLASDKGARGPVPASIRDAVWARLARLGVEERTVLETMSVMPGGVEPALLTALLPPDLTPALERCIALGVLIRSPEAGLQFRHELARLGTLARLSAEAQRALHARVEAAIAEMPTADSALLSRRFHHAAGAADGARVLKLGPKAAARAARLGAHHQAAEYLATTLRFIEAAPPAVAAQLHEDWAYEAGLADRIDDEVIGARHRAIAIWRSLGRIDKAGHNLRWLSRLHWYRGESALALDFADQAVRELEGAEPSPELAMAYSLRSQINMLNDRPDEAVDWGERAIALAESFGAVEIRVHALNNIGTALLFADRPGGRELLEESLSLALSHDFHEHAARAYTNLAEYAVVFKDFALAESILAEGLAFDVHHDLDAWTYYLVGRQAQLRMEQGRLEEAETIAGGVTALDRLTLVMRLPALTVLAKARMRLGRADGVALLKRALAEALATAEPQNIVPIRLALVEAAWLAADRSTCHAQLAELMNLDHEKFDPWELGEIAVWRRRATMPGELDGAVDRIPAARAAELDGDAAAAAAEWQRLGLPYEQALSLLQIRGPEANAALARAVVVLEEMKARPAATFARNVARRLGAEGQLPRRRRGSYAETRRHPLGLTRREQEVLGWMIRGAGNKQIARRLSRSSRTVEHHVSSLLGKLGVANRMEAMLRVRGEPWLLSDQYRSAAEN